MNDTTHLLSIKTNKKRLLESIAQEKKTSEAEPKKGSIQAIVVSSPLIEEKMPAKKNGSDCSCE